MKVLLALDGSAASLTARDFVARLAWPSDTVVHVISAYQVPVDWTGGVGSTMDWVGDAEQAMSDQLHEELATAAAALQERGLRVERHVVQGRAGDAIVDLAARLHVDLIVTGSRGRGRLRSMLLGSVASEVSAHAPCPVLVVREGDVTRLLVATDGSAHARAIPDLLARWGLFSGLPIDVVAVSIPDSPGFELAVSLYTLGNERLAEQRHQLRLASARDAEELAERFTRLGMRAHAHVRSGDPSAEIVAAARDLDADLIVTGSRGLGALGRLLLGSVARNVLQHAGCSVLIVRGATTGGSEEEKE